MNDKKVPKRISTAILNSLTSGVVPRIGLEYIAVGRKKEISTILSDLDIINEGGAVFRFIVGRFGSGKSFLLQLIRNYAIERNFIVSDVDLSPEKKLSGSSNQGLATYRELIQRLSSKPRPDGGALEAILQKWINGLKLKFIENGINPDDEILSDMVNSEIYRIISSMESFAHGFDFASVISAYYKGFINDDDKLKQSSIKWLRGEFSTKREAKEFLNVGEIITDANWYDYIKLMAEFLSVIGYKGFVIFIDEAINLYKISNRQARENNYEKLLSMFNDIMQGKTNYLGIYMGGTPQFIEDERRGLYSYEALRSRLEGNRFAKSGYLDLSGPIIHLQQLTMEEIFVLLEKLTYIHSKHYNYEMFIKDSQITKFLQDVFNRAGSEKFLTPREITRDYLGLLNVLLQNENINFDELLSSNFVQENIDIKEDDDIFKDIEI